MSANPVVHFELPADDQKRMADFYSKAFGWKMQFMGKDMSNYIVVQTADTDEKGMVKTPGTINGGIYRRTKDKYSQYPSIVIAVDDLNKALNAVMDAGGKLHGKPEDIPGVGTFASIIDTEGNRVSLLQPLPRTA